MSTEPPSTASSRPSSPRTHLGPRHSIRRSLSRASIRSLAGAAPGTPILPPSAAPAQLSVPDSGFSLSASPSSATTPNSSASSMSVNNDEANTSGVTGILVQPADDDAEEGDSIERPSGDEDVQKVLREQLKKSLSRRTGADAVADVNALSASVVTDHTVQDLEVPTTVNFDTPRQYYILTNAGKPVFTTRADADSDDLASGMGVVQAIMSVFADDGDKLRCINCADGRTRITFVSRSPLYYVCVSSWGEPESVTRLHLEYLHLQILSVVTARQLQKIFEKRTNFDLRRLLEGTDGFLRSLITRLELDLAMTTASLGALRIDPALRNKVADALVPTSKIKDMLYVVLVAGSRVITLARPRKHSIHPGDLHVLLNTVTAPSLRDSPASWLPICLPKFNPAGFLHAYVASVRPAAELTLVLVSGGGADGFERVRGWADTVMKKLEDDGTLDALERAVAASEYSVAELNVPGLRHFVYKSRAHVQVTVPRWEEPYEAAGARRRLIIMYQRIHDAIHAKSGQEGPLKLQYIRTEHESVMGWVRAHAIPVRPWLPWFPNPARPITAPGSNLLARVDLRSISACRCLCMAMLAMTVHSPSVHVAEAGLVDDRLLRDAAARRNPRNSVPRWSYPARTPRRGCFALLFGFALCPHTYTSDTRMGYADRRTSPDYTTVRAVHHAITASAQECGSGSCERSRAVGETRGGTPVPARRSCVLRLHRTGSSRLYLECEEVWHCWWFTPRVRCTRQTDSRTAIPSRRMIKHRISRSGGAH